MHRSQVILADSTSADMLKQLRAWVRPLGLGKGLLRARITTETLWYRGMLEFALRSPEVILCTCKAYGDGLLLTAVARALAQRQAGRVGVVTPYPELFAHNPDVPGVFRSSDDRYVPLLNYIDKLKYLHYTVHTDTPGILQSPREHIIAIMCRAAGITGAVDLLPRIHLLEKEKAAFAAKKETIVVQSSIANAGYPLINKEWYPERMQAVVNEIGRRFDVVQLGMKTDHPLSGVIDLRGKLKIREVASVLANARAFVGLVGFLMHLARAVDCPSVIVYGGREAPWQSGYTCNENIYREVECAPCWREDVCPYGRHCMTAIDASAVIHALDVLLGRSRALAVDTALIS